MALANRQIEAAAETLGGEFTSLDPGTIAVTLGGFGLGLFTAEFGAELTAGNMTKQRTRVAVELLTKLGIGAGEVYGGLQMSGLLAVILLFAGIGTFSSMALDVATIVVNVLQGHGVSTQPGAADAVDDGYTGDATYDRGGQESGTSTNADVDGAAPEAGIEWGGNPSATA